MALIILEGLDRTGKSSVAKHFQDKDGYELIHLSAPKVGTTNDEYLQDMVDLITSAASKNIVLDRSHYGELIWPGVYGRKALLSEDDFEVLRELEESVGIRRVLMHDPNVEAHWQRCVANKEPLTKAQFLRARSLYSAMGHKWGFETLTLPEFTGKKPEELNGSSNSTEDESVKTQGSEGTSSEQVVRDLDGSKNNQTQPSRSVHGQINATVGSAVTKQLEAANAINEVLSKKIIKQKGDYFDKIENDIRNFLTDKLANLLGTNQAQVSLSPEEIKFYKAMYKRAIEKENK